MIKKYVLAALSALVISPAFAQSGSDDQIRIKGAEQIKYDKKSNMPDFVRFDSSVKITAADFTSWLTKTLSLPSATDFRQKSVFKDDIGYEHIRFQQFHHNYPVEGHIVIAHIKNGYVESWNGEIAKLNNVSPAISIDKPTALQGALASVKANAYMWQNPGEEKALKEITGNPAASHYPKGEIVFAPVHGKFQQDAYIAAYKFDIYASEPVQRANVFINAATGKEMFRLSRLYHADSTGSAQTRYTGTQSIKTEYINGQYRLYETGRANGIRTKNLNKGTSFSAATDFTDSDNIWNNRNSNHDDVATDAHWGSEATFDYYMTRHNRNSYDNNGGIMWSFVHYSVGYNNAFWNGYNMTYGDGDNTFMTPLTSLDVVGHEFTHGVTDYTADLVYLNESGALNESFSDIFGAAIDFMMNPSAANYLIGESVMKSGGAFRNMANPNAFGDPDTYGGRYWKTGTADNGGVHSNSGVQNFWFYLLAEGGSGTNDLGNDYNITAIGREKAERIAYRNLNTQLSNLSDYDDAATGAAESARQLFGTCTPELAATKDAWYAVGVGSPAGIKASFLADNTYACQAPATITFSNQSFNSTTYYWDFGDGTFSTAQNPTHTYNQAGNYSVKLRVTGSGTCGSGVDSVAKTSYIQVVSTGGPLASSCNSTATTPMANMGIKKVVFNTISKESGDATEGYQDFTCNLITNLIAGNVYELTLQTGPPPAQRAKAYIDYNNDGIFDPVTELACDLGQFVIGTTGIVRTPTNAVLNTPLRMRVVSDMYNNPNVTPCGTINRGQAEDYAVQFTANTSMPDAKFKANLVYINSGQSVTYSDLSDFAPTSWEWQFPGGIPATSTAQNPVVTYPYGGKFDAVLIVRNSFGADTLFRPGYMEVNGPVGVKGNLETAANLEVYPNPATAQLNVSYKLEGSKTLTLRLLNVVGQEVYSTKEKVFGTYETSIAVNHLPAGLYFLSVDDGSSPAIKKVLIEK